LTTIPLSEGRSGEATLEPLRRRRFGGLTGFTLLEFKYFAERESFINPSQGSYSWNR
jgi:hypothetical protein